MTAIELVNLALLKIGVSKGIAALDEASREAWTANLVYDHVLRSTLRSFPWAFATKYAPLELVQGPAWDEDALVQAWDDEATYAVGDVVDVAGTFYYCILAHLNHTPPNATYWSTDATEEANGDWDYAYRWPVDCLFGRRMVPATGSGREFNPDPIAFRLGRDVNGQLFYTDEPEAVLEYTVIDCDALWADDIFIDGFTWRLAAALAPSLSKDSKMAEKCHAMAKLILRDAAVVGSNEAQLSKPGDAEWITGR